MKHNLIGIFAAMLTYTDQTARTIELQAIPKRIISIVPSQSEFLWHLGLKEELIGITKFCIHPDEMFRSVERVGGTKKLDIEKIRRLKPDLIIGNKEENERADIEQLQKEFPVWMSDIYTLEDAFKMMAGIGEIVNRTKEAEEIVNKLNASMVRIKRLFPSKKVAYFIWNKPYMLAAKHTFIDHMLHHLGFENAAASFERYPEVNEAMLRNMHPDLCFLSSEPFPFKAQHVNELQQILPDSKILIVDGEVFSWYGTRLAHLEGYVKSLSL